MTAPLSQVSLKGRALLGPAAQPSTSEELRAPQPSAEQEGSVWEIKVHLSILVENPGPSLLNLDDDKIQILWTHPRH